ncbi:unnamed protein product, partial [Rotaria socialis]
DRIVPLPLLVPLQQQVRAPLQHQLQLQRQCKYQLLLLVV